MGLENKDDEIRKTIRMWRIGEEGGEKGKGGREKGKEVKEEEEERTKSSRKGGGGKRRRNKRIYRPFHFSVGRSMSSKLWS